MADRHSSWDRFQYMLESMRPGEEVHVTAAARDSGLPPATCEHVLEALAQHDLFTRTGDHVFVRRRMFDQEQVETDASTLAR